MKKKIAVLFLVFSMVFISCDQDFNTIGGDLVGDEHFDFDKYVVQGLKAYSVKTEEVQTNNLAINPIGIYNNPYFGQTQANFVTQASITTLQPKFGTNVQVENVTLYIPYFSTAGETNADDETTYTLDSIFGSNKESKIKLSVYENGYFLNSFDPNTEFQDSQRYYNNGTSNAGIVPIDFDGSKIGHNGSGDPQQNGIRLNDSPNAAENDQFFFNKNEIVVYKKKFNTISGVLEFVDENDVVTTDPTKYVVKERLAPGIYLTLNKEFFKKRILDASASNLYNNNSFRQYFKGLYFKTELVAGQEGAMAMLNFNNAKLNLNYSSINDGAAAGAVATSKTFVMNFGTNAGGNTVSLQNFNYSGAYNTGLTASATNPSFGADSNLYLKGGKGSVVYMDLFGDADALKIEDGQLVSGSNSVPDELDQLRLNGWLINDAYIEFYIDKAAMNPTNQVEAERLYLFDATNQKPLVDYTFDSSTNSNPKRGKANFGGMIERDNTTEKKGVKYKIRVTQYINNILNSKNVNVNKNVKLGLCITENINLATNFYYKEAVDLNSTPFTNDDVKVKVFPTASILSQEGVVLHGTHPALPANADKRLKLTIHYTKPN
jgi:hypothetical protein